MDSEQKQQLNPHTNHALRVLAGHRLHYTVRVNMPDGTAIEFQSDKTVEVHWNDQCRERWIVEAYPHTPIMPYPEGAIILCEENPDVKK